VAYPNELENPVVIDSETENPPVIKSTFSERESETTRRFPTAWQRRCQRGCRCSQSSQTPAYRQSHKVLVRIAIAVTLGLPDVLVGTDDIGR
jgi:hypothetical protein